MDRGRGDYASYLLRLRRSDWDGQPNWRASLESTRDGQRTDFGSVEELVAFLTGRFGRGEHSAACKGGGPDR
jgi:hypothetical protein